MSLPVPFDHSHFLLGYTSVNRSGVKFPKFLSSKFFLSYHYFCPPPPLHLQFGPWSPISNHHMPYPAANSRKGHRFHLIPFVWIGDLANFALSPRTYPPQFDLVRLVRFKGVLTWTSRSGSKYYLFVI